MLWGATQTLATLGAVLSNVSPAQPATGPGDLCKISVGKGGPEHVDWKWAGGASVGTKVYFAPKFADTVGILDTETSHFRQVDIPYDNSASIWYDTQGRSKYSGAAAVGSKVYFAPHAWDNVGVMDAKTDTFSEISIGPTIIRDGLAALEDFAKYSDATAVGTKVFFTPFSVDNIGVLDTVTSAFSTISTLNQHANVTGEAKYMGATAIGTTIYFAPSGDNVGILDTVTNAFTTLSTYSAKLPEGPHDWEWHFQGEPAQGNMYNGAVAVGTTVYFAPYFANNVGVLDTVPGLFTTIGIRSARWHLKSTRENMLSAGPKYAGGVAIRAKVYFAPYLQDDVGVLDTVTRIFSTISTAALIRPKPSFPAIFDFNFGVDDAPLDVNVTVPFDATPWIKYSGAVAVGSNVYFVPQNEDYIGVLDASDNHTNVEANCLRTFSEPSPPPSSPSSKGSGKGEGKGGGQGSSSVIASDPQATAGLPIGMQVIGLLVAGAFIISCVLVGFAYRHLSKRAGNLRQSRDRAQMDLSLLAHQVSVGRQDWSAMGVSTPSTVPMSLPPAPPSSVSHSVSAQDEIRTARGEIRSVELVLVHALDAMVDGDIAEVVDAEMLEVIERGAMPPPPSRTHPAVVNAMAEVAKSWYGALAQLMKERDGASATVPGQREKKRRRSEADATAAASNSVLRCSSGSHSVTPPSNVARRDDARYWPWVRSTPPSTTPYHYPYQGRGRDA